MMRFKSNLHHYTAETNVHGVPLMLIFDTGASDTVLSYNTVRDITEGDTSALPKFINASTGKSAVGINKLDSKIIPCYLRNVLIDDVLFPKFYFGLGMVIKYSLLGWDFVDACFFGKRIGGDLQIKEFDYARYEMNFGKRYSQAAHELLYLGDSQLDWFLSLSDSDKKLLQLYSAPLYKSLTVGRYSNDLDALLEGFRKQYNL